MAKKKIKYVSIKLPACGTVYPLDEFGCRQLPDYNAEYLKKHGRKLFKVLFDKVPGTVYTELLRLIKEKENL